ncbi:hypothetical protein P5673_003019 [Acropora cervicornis]|uniref:Uncharacterized protein n=1 Tax=Acropora cervicornis TaxID=6130 RepID=A0AAD9VEL6_ACRCE|nr:hypothetical protein P5673_003019 [Acropora cervicornis]
MSYKQIERSEKQLVSQASCSVQPVSGLFKSVIFGPSMPAPSLNIGSKFESAKVMLKNDSLELNFYPDDCFEHDDYNIITRDWIGNYSFYIKVCHSVVRGQGADYANRSGSRGGGVHP